MTCRLYGAKPLSEPMLGYYQLGPLWTNFSEILIKIQNFSLTKMHMKISSAKWRPLLSRGQRVNSPVLDAGRADVGRCSACGDPVSSQWWWPWRHVTCALGHMLALAHAAAAEYPQHPAAEDARCGCGCDVRQRSGMQACTHVFEAGVQWA